MFAREDAFLCPCPESLVFCGAVPLCQMEELDPVFLAFLTECSREDASRDPNIPTCVLRSMSCADASNLLQEVCDAEC